MTYHININEYQRIMFEKALAHMLATQASELKSQPGDDSVVLGDESLYHETQCMLSMLQDLPGIEAEDPGILHGLCL